MEKGYNSDVTVRGESFHIQTEDWGNDTRLVVSRVFKNGAVIKSFKTSYENIFVFGPKGDAEAIRLAMKDQHSKILDLLFSGQL